MKRNLAIVAVALCAAFTIAATTSKKHEVVILRTQPMLLTHQIGITTYWGMEVFNASVSSNAPGLPNSTLNYEPPANVKIQAAEHLAQLLDLGFKIVNISPDPSIQGGMIYTLVTE